MSKNKNYMSLQKTNNQLRRHIQEMIEYIHQLQDEVEQDKHELRYLHEFLHYKELDNEFSYFLKNSIEVYDENMPFSSLTLPE